MKTKIVQRLPQPLEPKTTYLVPFENEFQEAYYDERQTDDNGRVRELNIGVRQLANPQGNDDISIVKKTSGVVEVKLKDQLKQKIINADNKSPQGLSITGDVTKEVTLTLKDGTTLRSNFTDKDTIPGADVRLNSLNFNTGTGVLTGVKSDNAQITANLDGRYLPITTADRDYLKKNQVQAWAKATNKPSYSWGEISGKPDLNQKANATDLTNAISRITAIEQKLNEGIGTWSR